MDFEFLVIDDHAVVKRYNGENTEVIIPQKYNDFPVTRIANSCFSKSNITTIVGKSIKSIGSGAFIYCLHLTSVNFPVCEYVGTDSFYDCSSLTEINLPSCKYADTNTFKNCTRLTSANLPVCEYVGEFAFKNCINLKSVNLPICTNINDYVFFNCSNLTEINLPVCEYVGDEAFYDCTSLIKKGRYKATNIDLTCRDFHYEIGKWFEEDEALLCKKGFHYVENFYDIFNYYHGKLGKDLRIFEVETDDVSYERNFDSKRVCKKIKLVKEIRSYQEIF